MERAPSHRKARFHGSWTRSLAGSSQQGSFLGLRPVPTNPHLGCRLYYHNRPSQDFPGDTGRADDLRSTRSIRELPRPSASQRWHGPPSTISVLPHRRNRASFTLLEEGSASEEGDSGGGSGDNDASADECDGGEMTNESCSSSSTVSCMTWECARGLDSGDENWICRLLVTSCSGLIGEYGVILAMESVAGMSLWIKIGWEIALKYTLESSLQAESGTMRAIRSASLEETRDECSLDSSSLFTFDLGIAPQQSSWRAGG